MAQLFGIRAPPTKGAAKLSVLVIVDDSTGRHSRRARNRGRGITAELETASACPVGMSL
jgi:hypothetical protein